jgi:large subunit ribosomal protein L18
MSIERKIKQRADKRAFRVRSKLKQVTALPRVSVFRSLQHIYAQLIDDATHSTMLSCSSAEIDASGDKTAVAKAVGTELAKRAHKKGIKEVVFDRGSYLYHGRVKALAEGLREGGLQV